AAHRPPPGAGARRRGPRPPPLPPPGNRHPAPAPPLRPRRRRPPLRRPGPPRQLPRLPTEHEHRQTDPLHARLHPLPRPRPRAGAVTPRDQRREHGDRRGFLLLTIVSLDRKSTRLNSSHSSPYTPLFRSHGAVAHLSGAPVLLGSYHVSQQNTNTGKLTPSMLDSILSLARDLVQER